METREGAGRPEGSAKDPLAGFGAVFVISQKGGHARKQAVAAALEACGIRYEFFDAVMGAELPAGELAAVHDAAEALRHKTGSRKLHPSHIGCNLSHRGVYERMRDRGLPMAVILEDDAQPLPERFGSLEPALHELPDHWDLLYLGVRGNRRAPWTFGLKLHLWLPLARLVAPRKYRLRFAEAARLYMRPYSEHLDRAGYHQGTHAYAVSAKGAQVLHRYGLPITAPADATIGTLILEGKLNAFALRQDVFTTTGVPSQIVSALKA